MLKLNLQLFATGYANYLNAVDVDTTSPVTTGNVADPYSNTSSSVLAALSPEMKEYYSQYLIKDIGANLIHAQFLDTETLPKNHGRTIEWRKWDNFSKKTSALAEGVTPEPSKISVNPIRAELAQYGDWTLLTDLVQLQTIDNTLVEITEKHAQNAKLSLDTITREKLIAGNGDGIKVAYAGAATILEEVSSTITPADVARLTAYLRQNNAPTFDGSYVMIIHPYVAYDLMTNGDWIDVVKYSEATQIFKGEIGKLYGIRFVESTESKVTKPIMIAHGSAAGTEGLPAVKVSSYSTASSTYTITVPSDTFDTTATTGDIDTFKSTDFKNKYGLFIAHTDSTTKEVTVEELTVSSGTASTLVISQPTVTPAADDIIFAGGAARDGKDLFTCLVLGKGAGRKVSLNGDNTEMIVKPVGSAGSTDPLNQRGSVGWKVNGYTAAVTNSNYIYKYYCGSALTGAKAND